jgi:hypothetical protein
VTQAGIDDVFSDASVELWDEFSHEFTAPPAWVRRIEQAREDAE